MSAFSSVLDQYAAFCIAVVCALLGAQALVRRLRLRLEQAATSELQFTSGQVVAGAGCAVVFTLLGAMVLALVSPIRWWIWPGGWLDWLDLGAFALPLLYLTLALWSDIRRLRRIRAGIHATNSL